MTAVSNSEKISDAIQTVQVLSPPRNDSEDTMAHSILIVEDNAVMANLMQFNLKRADFDVVTASNGTSGLALASESRFDMIVTDHQMPGMSGAEMCRTLRQLPQYRETPILLCTAKGLELQLSTLQEEYGVTDMLYKPVSPRQLVSTVRELVSSAIQRSQTASSPRISSGGVL